VKPKKKMAQTLESQTPTQLLPAIVISGFILYIDGRRVKVSPGLKAAQSTSK
jgi:hypothetical protein